MRRTILANNLKIYGIHKAVFNYKCLWYVFSINKCCFFLVSLAVCKKLKGAGSINKHTNNSLFARSVMKSVKVQIFIKFRYEPSLKLNPIQKTSPICITVRCLTKTKPTKQSMHAKFLSFTFVFFVYKFDYTKLTESHHRLQATCDVRNFFFA